MVITIREVMTMKIIEKIKNNLKEIKNSLKGKKIDPINMALVGLLCISAVFSAIMVSNNNELRQTTVTPPTVDQGKTDEGDVVVDLDNDEEETVTTSSKANNSEKLILPIKDSNPEILVAFFDATAKDLTQPMYKIVKQGDTYYTSESKGVTYQAQENKEADVVATLSGTVESIKDDLLSGTIVTVAHENNVKTTYVGVHDVVVGVNAVLEQGDVIGKTGISTLATDNLNVIHFELTKEGKAINPEQALNKSINEF